MESTFDFQNEIKKTHNFIKKAIKFDTLLEQEMNVGTLVTQPRDTVGPQVASQKQEYNPKTQKYETATTKVQKMGFEGFFKALRDVLTSTGFKVTTFFTDLIPGPGGVASRVVGWMAWGAITLYDAYVVYVKNRLDKIPNLLSDIIGFIFKYFRGATPPAITAFIKDPGIIGKVSGSAIRKIYQEIVKYFNSNQVLPWVYHTLGYINQVNSLLEQAASWIEKQFSNAVTWFSDMIQKVVNTINEIRNLIKDIYPNIDKPSEIKNVSQNVGQNINYKLDPGKI